MYNMVSQAAKDAFSHVFATVRDYGIVDIGRQAALDVGVQPSEYMVVPKLCLKPIKLHANASDTVTKTANVASGSRAAECECVYIDPTRKDIRYKD